MKYDAEIIALLGRMSSVESSVRGLTSLFVPNASEIVTLSQGNPVSHPWWFTDSNGTAIGYPARTLILVQGNVYVDTGSGWIAATEDPTSDFLASNGTYKIEVEAALVATYVDVWLEVSVSAKTYKLKVSKTGSLTWPTPQTGDYVNRPLVRFKWNQTNSSFEAKGIRYNWGDVHVGSGSGVYNFKSYKYSPTVIRVHGGTARRFSTNEEFAFPQLPEGTPSFGDNTQYSEIDISALSLAAGRYDLRLSFSQAHKPTAASIGVVLSSAGAKTGNYSRMYFVLGHFDWSGSAITQYWEDWHGGDVVTFWNEPDLKSIDFNELLGDANLYHEEIAHWWNSTAHMINTATVYAYPDDIYAVTQAHYDGDSLKYCSLRSIVRGLLDANVLTNHDIMDVHSAGDHKHTSLDFTGGSRLRDTAGNLDHAEVHWIKGDPGVGADVRDANYGQGIGRSITSLAIDLTNSALTCAKGDTLNWYDCQLVGPTYGVSLDWATRKLMVGAASKLEWDTSGEVSVPSGVVFKAHSTNDITPGNDATGSIQADGGASFYGRIQSEAFILRDSTVNEWNDGQFYAITGGSMLRATSAGAKCAHDLYGFEIQNTGRLDLTFASLFINSNEWEELVVNIDVGGSTVQKTILAKK